MKLRYYSILLFIAAAISACSKSDNPAELEFWPWFESRVSDQRESTPKEENEITIQEIYSRLKRVHSEFGVILGYAEDGTREMSITVKGKSEHFAAVVEFVAKAPKIDGWKFFPLKQPQKFDPSTELKTQTGSVKLESIRYAKSKKVDGTIDLTIYVPVIVKGSDLSGDFKNFLELLATDSLGERFASTLGVISFRELTDASPNDLLPFVDILDDLRRDHHDG